MNKTTEDNTKENGDDPIILYKNSNNTISTQSKTESEASQFTVINELLQIKKKLQTSNNSFKNRSTLKRNFSVETDRCILRRYYLFKRNKISNQECSHITPHSTLSQLSDAEVGSIDKYVDSSACGDNEEIVRINYPVNLDSLMIENLKELIKTWMQKHLLYSEDKENNIDIALESILNNLNDNIDRKSSFHSSYVSHRSEQVYSVKNETTNSTSFTCSHRKQKCENMDVSKFCSEKGLSYGAPCETVDIKIISTLSIPRNVRNRITEKRKETNASPKITKTKARKAKSSHTSKKKNSLSFNLLLTSTESLPKSRLFAYGHINKKKKRHMVFFPKSFFKNVTTSTSTTQPNVAEIASFQRDRTKLDEMSNPLKNIFFNSRIVSEKHTMTELSKESVIQRVSFVKTNIRNEQRVKFTGPNDDQKIINHKESLLISKSTYTNIIKSKFKLTQNTKRLKKCKIYVYGNKVKSKNKFNNSLNKHFKDLYKRYQTRTYLERNFLKCFQTAFLRFTECNNNENVKIDVFINKLPLCEQKDKYISTNTSNQALNNREHTLLYNVLPTKFESEQYTRSTMMNSEFVTTIDIGSENNSTFFYSPCSPNIVPILDGGVSQDKYILNVDSREQTETNPNLEVLQEISELKTAIKELATAAQTFLNEKLMKKNNKTNVATNINFVLDKDKTFSSKGETTQVSNIHEKSLDQSNFKKEEPNNKEKEAMEYYNRISRKSTSYRIIDSESVLKVTDMTSKANEIEKPTPQFADKALTCSLLKSKSFFRKTTDRNVELMTLFCDNYIKPAIDCDRQIVNPSSVVKSKPRNYKNCPKYNFCSKCNKTYNGFHYNSNGVIDSQSVSDANCDNSVLHCPSLTSIGAQHGSDKTSHRRGMRLEKGCIYCILLCIAVILILFSLFYYYILERMITWIDTINGISNYSHPLEVNIARPTLLKHGNKTVHNTGKQRIYNFKLSDLGFR